MLGENGTCQASFFFPPVKILLYRNGKLTSSFADILLYGYALMVVFANGDLSALYKRRVQRFLSWDFSVCGVFLCLRMKLVCSTTFVVGSLCLPYLI